MLLASVLRRLTSEEIERIRTTAHLPERSRLIFERIASSPNAPPPTKALCSAFHITKANLYRILSAILDECLRVVSPKEEFGILNFYATRYLYRPFVTELSRLEKQLRSQHDNDALERLYSRSFTSVMGFPVGEIDIDLLFALEKKLSRVKKDVTADDMLILRLRIAIMQISKLPAKKKLTLEQMDKQAQRIMEPLRKEALESSNPFVLYRYYHAEWKATMFDHHQYDTGIEWVRKILELIRTNRSLFSEGSATSAEIEYANAICNKQHEIALAIYRKHYQPHPPETTFNILFFIRYAYAACLANEFSVVRELLHWLDKSQTIKVTPRVCIMVEHLHIELALLENNLAAASQHIDTARELLVENFFLVYDLELRAFECLLALKVKDYVKTEQLVRRNIRWLRSRRFTTSRTSWITFYNMIDAIIQTRMTGEVIRQPVRRAFDEQFKQEFRMYHHLLSQEI